MGMAEQATEVAMQECKAFLYERSEVADSDRFSLNLRDSNTRWNKLLKI